DGGAAAGGAEGAHTVSSCRILDGGGEPGGAGTRGACCRAVWGSEGGAVRSAEKADGEFTTEALLQPARRRRIRRPEGEGRSEGSAMQSRDRKRARAPGPAGEATALPLLSPCGIRGLPNGAGGRARDGATGGREADWGGRNPRRDRESSPAFPLRGATACSRAR